MSVELSGVGLSLSDVIHKVINTTCIITYGIIKEILDDNRVTVMMSSAESESDVIITDCTLASFASSAFSIDIKPQIDDKVIVLYPKDYHGDMFDAGKNVSLLTDCPVSYSLFGGIAILLNQFQEDYHKNSVTFEEGGANIKLAYSTDDRKNLFTCKIKDSGEVNITSNKSKIDITKSGITIEDENGCKIETSSASVKINGKLEILK